MKVNNYYISREEYEKFIPTKKYYYELKDKTAYFYSGKADDLIIVSINKNREIDVLSERKTNWRPNKNCSDKLINQLETTLNLSGFENEQDVKIVVDQSIDRPIYNLLTNSQLTMFCRLPPPLKNGERYFLTLETFTDKIMSTCPIRLSHDFENLAGLLAFSYLTERTFSTEHKPLRFSLEILYQIMMKSENIDPKMHQTANLEDFFLPLRQPFVLDKFTVSPRFVQMVNKESEERKTEKIIKDEKQIEDAIIKKPLNEIVQGFDFLPSFISIDKIKEYHRFPMMIDSDRYRHFSVILGKDASKELGLNDGLKVTSGVFYDNVLRLKILGLRAELYSKTKKIVEESLGLKPGDIVLEYDYFPIQSGGIIHLGSPLRNEPPEDVYDNDDDIKFYG